MKIKLDKIIVAFILVIIVAVAQAVLVGAIILQSNSNIKQIQADIKAEDIRRQRFDELVKRYKEVESEGLVVGVTDLLPTANGFLDVITEIENIGKLSGSRLVISLGQARLTKEGFELPNELRNQSVLGRTLPENANYDFLEVSISVRGSYDQLTQFINLFEQSKYYMNITSININRVNTEQQTFIDASLTVEIFVQQVLFN